MERSLDSTPSLDPRRKPLITNFLAQWTEVSKDESSESQLQFQDMISTLRKDRELSDTLYPYLATMEPEDAWKRPEMIISCLEAILHLDDSEQSEHVLRLLYDADNPLWKNRGFLPVLSDICDSISAEQLAEYALDIATACIFDNKAATYRIHLGKLVSLLISTREFNNNPEDKRLYTNTIEKLEAARAQLRSAALASAAMHLPEAKDPHGFETLAKQETAIIKGEGKRAGLLPAYFLKAIPVLGTNHAPSHEHDFPEIASRHQLAELEAFPHPLTPTIGVEVEIRKDAILPKESALWSPGEQQEYLARLKTEFEATEFAAIPQDTSDWLAFHEFAFSPKNNYLSLSRELQLLMNRGYIPETKRPPAIHITLGDVHARLDQKSENEAYVLARIMEATAWSTSHRRLLRKYSPTDDLLIGWDAKGLSGVVDKQYDQFITARTEKPMVEFRTFQLKNFAGMNRTLAGFQSLGAAMLATQIERGWAGSLKEKSKDSPVLAAIWHELEERSRQLFLSYGLRDPKKPYAPIQPENDTQDRYGMQLRSDTLTTRSGFYKLADLLKEATEDPTSDGSLFVSDARKLVIEASRKIAPIIYKR